MELQKNYSLGAYDSGSFKITDGNTPRLTIASTGAASFSSSVTAGGNILINNSGTTIANIGATSSQGGLNLYSGATADYNGGALITLVSSDRSGAYTRGELYISAGRATNNTANGFIALSTGDTERMRITSGGWLKTRESCSSTTAVHILRGDTTSDAVVQVNNSNASNASDGMLAIVATRNTTNNTFYALGYYNAGSESWRFRVADSGNVTSAGSVTATSFFESSDSRLKTLIQDNYQTKGIASITPKLYTKNGKVELGYYAQDFVGILDSAVSKGSDEMLSLSYREVHTAKIYALEQEIKELKAKMN